MDTACVSLEPFALEVLDDELAPDLPAGAIVVVDPGEPARDGSFVLLQLDGEVVLRRLRLAARAGDGATARFVAADGPEIVPGSDWRRSVRGVVTAVRTPRGHAAATASPGPDGPSAAPRGR